MNGYLGEFEPDVEHPYIDNTPSDWALEYIIRYGGIDGAHHKDWVMDQVARILKGTPIILKVARWSNGLEEYRFTTGEPSKEYLTMIEEAVDDDYDWNVGIAP